MVSVLYKDYYGAMRQKLNFWIILHILLKKTRQSRCYYASLIDRIIVLNNFNLQKQSHKIIFQIIMDVQVWISNGILKAGMIKNIDKVGKLIKGQEKIRFEKRLKLYSLNIEKSSNKMVSTMEKQQTVRLTDKLLSIKSQKTIILHVKTKV